MSKQIRDVFVNKDLVTNDETKKCSLFTIAILNHVAI